MIATAISGFDKDALTGAPMIEFVLSLVRNSHFGIKWVSKGGGQVRSDNLSSGAKNIGGLL